MNLFDVYPLWDIEPVRGQDTTLWDKNGEVYTDLYGGHAVISVGHCHPHYVKKISEQVGKLGFYSNAVQNGAWILGLSVAATAPDVLPWNALRKARTLAFPVWNDATFSAFSFASAPLLQRNNA